MRVVYLLVKAVIINNVAAFSSSDYLWVCLTIAFAHCKHDGLGFSILLCNFVYLTVSVCEDAGFFLKLWFNLSSARTAIHLWHHGDS